MRRRDFIAIICATAAVCPLSAFAQGGGRRPLIAVLNLNSSSSVAPRLGGFIKAMFDLGYVNGRDFEIADRYADGVLDRLPVLAEELIRLRPNLLVAGSMPAAFAAHQTSNKIAIVCVGLVDPVGLHLAVSEARPEGQVTGILISVEGLIGKQLALAIEIIPNASRVGLLTNPGNQGHAVQRQGAETAAAALSRNLIVAEASSPKDIDQAFDILVSSRCELVLVLPDPIFNRENRRIAVLAAANRLPTMFAFREYIEAGGMMSYGVSLGANWQRAAYFADRILKGEKAGDLPIELPTKLEMVINSSTAKAIGATIPEQILLRADVVIE